MPWASRIAESGQRGLGAEIRILVINPDKAERRARDAVFTDGYTFAVGTPLPA
jgi:hypothetical protein